jgi:hypothetical protein
VSGAAGAAAPGTAAAAAPGAAAAVAPAASPTTCSTTNWALGPSNTQYAIASLGAAGTSHSFELVGGGGYFAGPNVALDGSQPRRVSFWMRMASFGGGGQSYGFFVISSDTRAVNQLVYITVTQTGPVVYQGGGGFPTTQMEINRWYHFDIALDWQTRTFTLALDGGAPSTFTFGSPMGNGAMRLDLFNAADTALNFWDEIEIAR